MRRVLAAAYEMMGRARNQTPELTGVFTTFSRLEPADLSRRSTATRRGCSNVPIANIFETLQVNLGTSYVNDFNAFGRVYQVRAQADSASASSASDILRLKVRSATGALVPLGTLVEIRDVTGPDLVQRYNMYPSVPLQGNAAPGYSSATALDAMETPRPPGAAAGHELRVDRACLPGAPDRQHRHLHLRPVGAVRLPRAGRPI